jgi:hypothetical protein
MQRAISIDAGYFPHGGHPIHASLRPNEVCILHMAVSEVGWQLLKRVTPSSLPCKLISSLDGQQYSPFAHPTRL